MLSALYDTNKVAQLPRSRRRLHGFSQVSKPHYSVLFHGIAISKLNFNPVYFSDILFSTHSPLKQKKEKKKKHHIIAKPTV